MNDKIRVCHITTSFPRFEKDYAGIFIKKLTDQLAKFIILTVLLPSDKEKIDRIKKYRIIPVRYTFRKFEDFFYRGGGIPQQLKSPLKSGSKLMLFMLSMILKTFLIARNVDIIHTHWVNNGIFGILPKLIFGCKLCVTMRGSDLERIKNNKADKFISSLVIKKADAIITVNKQMIDELLNEFIDIKKKIFYIPNGVDVGIKNELNNIKDDSFFTIIFVGNLVEEKGVHELKYVYERLYDDKLKLIIIGSGILFEDLKSWNKDKNLNVKLKGNLPNSEVINEMKNADLLVLPSHNEGRPNVILEAMANRLPVLASSLPGIKEIIEHKKTGLLFEPRNRDEFLSLLKEHIHDNNQLSQYAENAYEFLINENITWEACAASHLKLYNSFICNK